MRERETDDLSDYQGILEGNGIFYVPRPAMPGLLAKIDTLATSVRIAIPAVIQKTQAEPGKTPHLLSERHYTSELVGRRLMR